MILIAAHLGPIFVLFCRKNIYKACHEEYDPNRPKRCYNGLYKVPQAMTFTFTIALTPTAIAQHKTVQCSTTFAVQYSYSADTVQLQYSTVHGTVKLHFQLLVQVQFNYSIYLKHFCEISSNW